VTMSESSAPISGRPASADARLPLVSVIVPTYNRSTVLPYLFSALARQLYPAKRMELIVVDNSSDDDTELVVGAWARVLPFLVHFYRKENKGPACSRNYGAARARGELLAFTDSDCVPAVQWLRESVRAYQLGAGVVGGPIFPRQRPGGPGLRASQLDAYLRDRGLYPTANLVVRRAAFEAVGGFDERFGLYPWGDLVAGEDADLAWRVRRTGERAAFAPRAVVGHLATPLPLFQLLVRPVRVQILPRLLRSIPELRDVYFWNRYWLSSARIYFYLLLASMLGVALTGSWLPLLGALPFIVYHARGTTASLLRRGQIVKGIVWLGFVVWLEAVTTATLLVASVRYRRLVL
jgi:glycosyltransferase involved in cell wall biosynthesis